MQFSVIALFSLAALASATPHGLKARQEAAGGPTVQQPAMTDQNGNVISFDATNVYKASEGAAAKKL